MVSNQPKALKALHQLLVHGRSMAFEGMPSQELAYFFDDIELLPALIMDEQSADENFGAHLKQLCINFKCSHIFSQYQSGFVSLK